MADELSKVINIEMRQWLEALGQLDRQMKAREDRFKKLHLDADQVDQRVSALERKLNSIGRNLVRGLARGAGSSLALGLTDLIDFGGDPSDPGSGAGYLESIFQAAAGGAAFGGTAGAIGGASLAAINGLRNYIQDRFIEQDYRLRALAQKVAASEKALERERQVRVETAAKESKKRDKEIADLRKKDEEATQESLYQTGKFLARSRYR